MTWLNAALRVGIVVSAGLLFAAFCPGGMSIDSYTQLLEARGGHLGDWHPPFMAWLWGGLDAIVPGPLLMLAAQLGLYLVGLAAIARVAIGGGDAGRAAFVLLSLLMPPVAAIAGIVWKDTWLSALLLMGAACCMAIASIRQPVRRLAVALLGSLFLLGAMLFRLNAVFAVVPLAVYAVWALRGSPRAGGEALRAVTLGLVCTLALLLVSAGINRALTSERLYPLQSIFIFDVVGISVATHRTDLLEDRAAAIPDVLRGRTKVDLAALRDAYFPSTWTPLVFVDKSPLAVTRSAAQVDALAAIWWRAVREEPAAYFAHRAAVFREVTGAREGPLFAPIYFDVPADSPDYVSARRVVPIAPGCGSSLQQALRDGLEASAGLVIYRPWLWLLLNVSLIVAAAFLHSRSPGLIALGSSGLLYELALFFIAPSADWRYSHWLVLSTWVVLGAIASRPGANALARATAVGEQPGVAPGIVRTD